MSVVKKFISQSCMTVVYLRNWMIHGVIWSSVDLVSVSHNFICSTMTYRQISVQKRGCWARLSAIHVIYWPHLSTTLEGGTSTTASQSNNHLYINTAINVYMFICSFNYILWLYKLLDFRIGIMWHITIWFKSFRLTMKSSVNVLFSLKRK